MTEWVRVMWILRRRSGDLDVDFILLLELCCGASVYHGDDWRRGFTLYYYWLPLQLSLNEIGNSALDIDKRRSWENTEAKLKVLRPWKKYMVTGNC
jgi:hypothetical protein